MADAQSTVPATATTPQQQPLGTPTQQNAPTPASVAQGSGDQLVCQWQSCGERLPSAEQLYVSRVVAPFISSVYFCVPDTDLNRITFANAMLVAKAPTI